MTAPDASLCGHTAGTRPVLSLYSFREVAFFPGQCGAQVSRFLGPAADQTRRPVLPTAGRGRARAQGRAGRLPDPQPARAAVPQAPSIPAGLLKTKDRAPTRTAFCGPGTGSDGEDPSVTARQLAATGRRERDFPARPPPAQERPCPLRSIPRRAHRSQGAAYLTVPTAPRPPPSPAVGPPLSPQSRVFAQLCP